MSMHRRVKGKVAHNSILRLLVPGMKTMEDYNKITKALREQGGIKEVRPFAQANILKLTYDPSITNVNSIAHLIVSLGYRFEEKNPIIKKYRRSKKGG